MSLASKIGTVVGTATAYTVHYIRKGATPLGVVSMVYVHRRDIQKFAVQHSLNKDSPDALQSNLLECLDYID
jgi:gamma-glutamyl phosphate reductase